jgi:membrane-associated phospholipid phosphatase
MNLPMITSLNKGKALLIAYAIFSFLYIVCGNVHLFLPLQFSKSNVDNSIPFIPESIFIYSSQLLFLFLALWNDKDEMARTKIFYAMLIATGIASFIFMIFPVELPRDKIEMQGIMAYCWQGLYRIDPSSNCFPSLHVTFAIIATNVLVSINSFWRFFAPSWALLICLSTLTTKQHYLIDVVGGVFLAMISLTLANLKIADKNNHEKHYQPN